jgi:hypothetical protein
MSRWKIPQHFKVQIGGNTYIDCPTIIDYKGTSVFELLRSETDGFLGINFDVYAKNGSKLATVRNGQFVGNTPDGYRIDGSADQYSLIEIATGRQVCDIKLRLKAPNDAELDVSAQMYMPDGKLIIFSPHETNLAGIKMMGNTFKACGAAIKIT